MEDCKWLREDRSRSKSVVGGQLVDMGKDQLELIQTLFHIKEGEEKIPFSKKG